MGEKEERIYIGKINLQEPLGFCPVPMGECNRFCEDCQGGMTRQEAIERISKVFVNLYIEIDGTGVTYTAKEVAEAALNALLEGK